VDAAPVIARGHNLAILAPPVPAAAVPYLQAIPDARATLVLTADADRAVALLDATGELDATRSALAVSGLARAQRLLGAERARRAYPYRSLLDAGVHLSFGSDIPGEATCDPLLSIHMAVNRPGGERITVLEALRCYTVGSAYAEFMEDKKGMLKEGMLADFVVLSQDITEIPSERIKGTVVEETVVGGRSVYAEGRP